MSRSSSSIRNLLCIKVKKSGSKKMDKKAVTAIVIGAGARGYGYSCYALACPEKLEIVGVAEPNDYNRERMVESFSLPSSMVFKSWTEILEKEKMADLAIICTQDRMHHDPAIAAAKMGYHILLEKPMAVTEEECNEIVTEVKKAGVMFGVCHVLRYYPGFRLLKEIVDSGRIGKVCHIEHTEPVGFYHYAHSYVRGNWRNEASSSSSLLAKCCHDVDLIAYWMGDDPCEQIHSFGSLMHFTSENKPAGAADRCLDCKIHESCPYSAQKVYLNGNRSWPVSAVVPVAADIEDLYEALKTGPYGRCVYNCDNDVMSNQTVSMKFKSGATASLNMVAFTRKLCARSTVISGTLGELSYDMGGAVRLYDFNTRKNEEIQPERVACPPFLGGHNGADFDMITRFIDAIYTKDSSLILAGPDQTLYSHQLVFSAEKSRTESTVVVKM